MNRNNTGAQQTFTVRMGDAEYSLAPVGQSVPSASMKGHRFGRGRVRSRNAHPERDVVLQKLASDLHYASFEIDTYEYKDQYGSYPSEQGYNDAYNLLMSVEGIDTAIEFVEEGADAETLPGYDDLLARLRARRDELASVGSASRKSIFGRMRRA